MHTILRFYYFFLFLFFTGHLSAQELRYSFKNFTPSDGLPSSETYQALEDANHYMWFATDHGVARYNGYEFETFNLPDNSIMGLYEDWKKRIWAFTFSGRLFYYENGKFHGYKWNDQLVFAIKPGVIQAMYVDSSDVVHVSSSGPIYVTITRTGDLKTHLVIKSRASFSALATTNRDFFVHAINYPESFYYVIVEHDTLTDLNISIGKNSLKITLPQLIQHERCKLKRLSNGKFILFSKDCYVIINSEEKFDLVKTTFTVDDVEEIDGKIFLATEHGVKITDNNGKIIESYLDGIHITSIEKDYEGGIWFTTLTNGAYYLSHFRMKHLAERGEIIDKRFVQLYKLRDLTILAGVHGNEVLRFKAGSFLETVKLKLKDIVSFYEVNSSFVLVGGSVGWFNTRLWEEDHTSKFGSVTYFQVPNSSNFIVKDSVLYSGLSSGIYEYKLGKFKRYALNSSGSFRTARLFLDNNGTILVGNHFGLWRYSKGDIVPYDSTKKILNSRITDISYYQNKILCLATRGKGMLLVFNDSVYQIRQVNGLVSDNIRRIYVDKNNIWLASNNGISIVKVNSLQPLRYSLRNITVQDGLLSNEINSIIKEGRDIVIASNNGISFISEDAIMAKQQVRLPLYIREIKIGNELGDSSALKELGYRKRNLTISYEALNYSATGRNNYRYRLKGFDTSWRYTNNREIQFNQLPYGNYSIEIQAKREYDDWNNPASFIQLQVLCTPPLWATTWFWIAAFSIVIFLVILFFRERISQIRSRQKQQEQLKQKINDTEQMALKAQMNPHFIFNSLNSIQQYVIDSDVKGANKFITGFSRLIRQTLEFSSKELITLDEEIDYLSTYLELEKARIESGFTYHVNVDTQQPSSQLELPPLLLQPYVENALRHGIRYLKNVDGIISLSFIEQNGFLECIIEDNGIGRKRAMELKAENPIEYQSRGMSLTAERIALLNEGKDRKIEVKIEDLKDEKADVAGTRIRVLFPV